MENKTVNFVTIGGGLLFGGFLVAAWTGVLTPAWSFFFNGMVRHFMEMQWAQFSCF